MVSVLVSGPTLLAVGVSSTTLPLSFDHTKFEQTAMLLNMMVYVSLCSVAPIIATQLVTRYVLSFSYMSNRIPLTSVLIGCLHPNASGWNIIVPPI